MRAELEEHGHALHAPLKALANRMHELGEQGWFGVFGDPARPKAVVLVTIHEEAEALLAWIKSRGVHVDPRPVDPAFLQQPKPQE